MQEDLPGNVVMIAMKTNFRVTMTSTTLLESPPFLRVIEDWSFLTGSEVFVSGVTDAPVALPKQSYASIEEARTAPGLPH